ncbi:30s ribosomal protein s13 [Dioszegia hungarica]|uniref:Small ribosomal subunit protein uS13m n=1 Tax=Dioszegia hungarica TaxID=4972 RepID=A0AA38HDU3_9TREE|nr:30s ribosomal protein s13 [Dioszegia hungarica]KAI9639362.1 30s ribosomal protein s13 [Dioszegia hungarica]
MHLLGRHLPDHKPLRIALTAFYGISHPTSANLLARLSIPLATRVQDLTEPQITSLSSFLSSPSTSSRPADTPLSTPGAGPSSTRMADPLDGLLIETDLRRKVQGDIAHLRQVGTYRGRRHALGLPVRGQNTRNNAKTAKKMNRVERRHYST